MDDNQVLAATVGSTTAALLAAGAAGVIANYWSGITAGARRVGVQVAAVWLWLLVTLRPPRGTRRRTGVTR